MVKTYNRLRTCVPMLTTVLKFNFINVIWNSCLHKCWLTNPWNDCPILKGGFFRFKSPRACEDLQSTSLGSFPFPTGLLGI
jgi:hypothetical protein